MRGKLAFLSKCWYNNVVHTFAHKQAQAYSQNRWLINQDECDSAKLLSMFNEFWKTREKNRQTILAQYHDVRRKIISEGKKMYGETK